MCSLLSLDKRLITNTATQAGSKRPSKHNRPEAAHNGSSFIDQFIRNGPQPLRFNVSAEDTGWSLTFMALVGFLGTDEGLIKI